MALKDQVRADITEALKSRDSVKAGTLRMVLAAFVNKEKEKGIALSQEDAQSVLAAEAKKRRDSIEAFEHGGRRDLAEREKAELAVLQAYLPEQLSEEEVRDLAKEAISNTGAAGLQDMGKVMADLMPKVKGRADGSLVSRVVKEEMAP